MLKCSFSRLLCFSPKLPLTFSRALSLGVARCMHTHYDTLNLKPSASSKEIKNAYLELSKKYHPDRNLNDPKSHDRFIKLQQAYDILSNSDMKKNYDATLKPSGSRPKSGGFSRPYGYPDFTQRDEWIRTDKKRQEDAFRKEFRKEEDFYEFNRQYSQPHRLTPEEMEQFYRFKSFSRRGKEIYYAFGFMIFLIIILEMYIARKKAKYYDYYSPYDDPLVSGKYPLKFNMEYETEKLVNDEKYREYLNREIKKGNVGPIEPIDK